MSLPSGSKPEKLDVTSEVHPVLSHGGADDEQEEGPSPQASEEATGSASPTRVERDDPRLKEMNVLEKKIYVVTQALNQMGMGRYSWCIFFLCGYGYALDLMWAQAFGLVATPAANEFGISLTSGTTYTNIFTSFNTGLTVGAFTWGLLVDIVGRKWAFNCTVLVSSIFGLVLGAAPNWNALCVLAAFTGFGIGGNIPIDASIVLEFIPQNRRYLLAALSLFQPFGVVIVSLICWGLIPKYSCTPPDCTKSNNMGWRYTTYTLGCITLFCFFLRFIVFRFQESPKFLLSKGRDEEAVAVVHRIAKFNRKPCPLTLEDLQVLSDGSSDSTDVKKPVSRLDISHLKGFFSSTHMTRLTVFTWLTYIFDYSAFSVAGNLLPSILQAKGAVAGQSTSTTYRNYIIIYAPGIVGVLLGALIIQVRAIGRRWAMTISAALMGVSLFLFVVIDSPAGNVGFNTMEYFFQSMFNAILYGWTPEAFPSAFRGSACGIASTWGRLASIIAPIIAGHILLTSLDGVLYLAGGASLLAALSTIFLPETSQMAAL